jgi:hypothetical protein
MIELIVAIAFFGVVLGVSVTLVHEVDRSPALHDAQRQLDLARVMQAVARYGHDHQALPTSVGTEVKVLGSREVGLDWCTALVPTYLKDLPVDPAIGLNVEGGVCDGDDLYSTGYTVERTKDGVLVLSAASEENAESLGISRKF